MNTEPMKLFLTEESIREHLGYLKHLKAKLSINEKSIPKLKGKTTRDILSMRIPRALSREMCEIKNRILSHEIYFSSFSEDRRSLDNIKRLHGTADSYRYEIFERANKSRCEFIYITQNRGRTNITECNDISSPELLDGVKLCIDLSEHSYFLDYRFDRERYLKSACYYLDLSRLCSD